MKKKCYILGMLSRDKDQSSGNRTCKEFTVWQIGCDKYGYALERDLRKA